MKNFTTITGITLFFLSAAPALAIQYTVSHVQAHQLNEQNPPEVPYRGVGRR